MKVSIIGLGKLGACMAAVFAHKGHEVIGVDTNRDTIRAINTGMAPVVEPGLQAMIAANRNRLTATVDYYHAIMNTELSFVVVPTPSEKDGTFSVKYAQSAFESIGKALKEKDAHHAVNLSSTVLPGDTREKCLPLLQEASGKIPGDDFSLTYSPEFIALGSVLRDFQYPDILLIGEYDTRSGDIIENFYQTIVNNFPSVHRMSIENAELAKIALNTFITTKITYANVITDLCERIQGGDCDAVLGAVGADSRVGKKYLKGGLGYGGPCFPRDNAALAACARTVGMSPQLMLKVDQLNRSIPFEMYRRIHPYLNRADKILYLGTSYKPCSNLTEESQAQELAMILSWNHQVFTYDPIAPCMLSAPPKYSDYPHIVIATPDPAFVINPDDLTPGTVVIDIWRTHEHLNVPTIKYRPVGRYSPGHIPDSHVILAEASHEI